MATISASRNGPVSSDSIKMETGMTHPYTCNTCQVAFRNSDLQKGHMRSDWHRYNLKRRVASLPPISAEVFSEKVVQARVETAAQEDKQGFQKSCDSCQKTYYSENSYRNHVTSAKHKARLAAMAARANGKLDDGDSIISSKLSLGDPAEDKSEVDTDAEVEFNEVVESLKKTGIDEVSPVRRPSNPHLSAAAQHKGEHPVSEEPSASTTPSTATPVASEAVPNLPTLKVCLFCNYESPTAPLNVLHMERIHGMFIPEKQYLVDPEGLLKHLQTRVFELNECLTCYKVKANSHAVQTHMRDKSHCQIPYTTEEEQLDIGDFYDFRSTYSDGYSDSEDEAMEDEEEPKPKPRTKLGGKRKTKTEGGGDNGEAEDGWETDSSESSLDSDDLHAVPAENHYHQYERLDKHPHHSRHDSRSHHQRDGWHAHNSNKRTHAVFYDDLELYLPSGRVAGHRSQRVLYRQNLHNYAVTAEEREAREALEAAQAEDEMDVDGEGKPRRATDKTHSRALVTREMQGLMRFIDPQTREFKKVLAKGGKMEVRGQKQKELEVSRMYFKQRHRNPVSYLR